MDPHAWFFSVLGLVSAPYVFLAVYRYGGNLFRRV